MATKTWNGSDADWNTPTDWSPTGTPGTSDVAIINSGDANLMPGDTPIDVQSITIGSSSGGVLSVNDPSTTQTVTGNVFVTSDGELQIDTTNPSGSTFSIGGNLTNNSTAFGGGIRVGNSPMTSATLVTVAGTFSNTGGAITINGGSVAAASATVDVTGAAPSTLTGSYNLIAGVGAAAMEWGSGGVTQIGDAASNSGYLQLSGANAFAEIGATNSNSALSGLTTIAGNGEMDLFDGATVTTSVGLTMDAGAYLRIDVGGSGSSELSVGGNLTNASSAFGGGIQVGNGGQSGASLLKVNGTVTNTGGSIVIQGGTVAPATATLDVTGAAPSTLTGSYYVVGNTGGAVLEWGSGAITQIGDGSSNSGFLEINGANAFAEIGATNSNSAISGLTTIAGNGEMDLLDGATVTTSVGLTMGAGAYLLLDNGGTGGSKLTVGGNLTNASSAFGGGIQVGNGGQSGASLLKVNGTVTNTGGSIVIQGGTVAPATATLDVTGAAPSTLTGSYYVVGNTGGAVLEWGSGAITQIGDGSSNSGLLEINGANAFAEIGATNSNSAISGLTTIAGNGEMDLLDGATVTTSVGLTMGAGAYLLLDNGGTGGSKLTVGGNLTNASSAFGGGIQVGNGGQSGASLLKVNGTVTNTGGSIVIQGGTVAPATATLDVTGAAPSTLTGSYYVVGNTGGAVLEWGSGAITQIGDGSSNSGLLEINGANAFAEIGATNSNSAISGLTTIAGNGEMDLLDGATVTTSVGLTMGAGAYLLLDNGGTGGSKLTVGGNLTNASSAFGGGIQVGNGGQSGASLLKVNGTVTNTGGSIVIQGGTVAPATATLDVTGAAPSTLTGSYYVVGNTGGAVLEWGSGAITQIGDGSSNSGLLEINGANAFAEIGATNSNSAISGLTTIAGNGELDLLNGATVTTSVGLTVGAGGYLLFDNGGVGGSTLTVNGNLTNNSSAFGGGIQVGGAAMSVADLLKVVGTFNNTGGSVTLLGGNTAGATAQIDVTGAAPSTLTGSYSLTANTGGATVEWGSGGITQIGDGASNSGYLGLNGANAFAEIGATNSNSALAGLATIAGNGELQLFDGASVTTGALTVNTATSSGYLLIDNQATGGSRLTVDGNLTNNSSAFGGGIQIGGTAISTAALVTVNGAFNNTGGAVLVGGATATATLSVNGAATNSGAIDVEKNADLTVTGSNAFTQTAGTTALFAGGTITAPNINIAGGTVSGDGTLTGTVNNNGGGSVEADDLENGNLTSTLTVTGNYNQSGSGVLEALVNPSGVGTADILHVTGNMDLQGGTLAVDPQSPMVLNTLYTIATFAPGHLFGEFSAVTYGSQTGDGGSVNAGGGDTLDVLYNNTTGTIQVELVTTPAATSYTWDTGTGSWDTAADWNPPNNGTTPSSTSAVTIGSTGNGNVTLSHDATIDSLTIKSGNTLASADSLTVAGNVNVATTATLNVANLNVGGTIADSGAITISGGGTLDSLGLVTVAAGASLNVSNGTILDTTLAGSGTMQATGTATLDNVTLDSGSTFTGTNGTTTFLEGTITNAGTIVLDGTTSVTELRTEPGATVTLTGGGVISLSNNVNNLFRDPALATGRVINVNNTIEGAGDIGADELSFDNQSAATFDANLTAGTLILQPNVGGFTNEGLLEATASGTLELNGQTFTQSGGGMVLSSGSTATVELVATTVVGGTLSATGGGLLETLAGQSATLDNLTISSGTTYTGANGSVTFLEGTINNQGTFFLDSSSASTTEIRTEPAATVTLTGGGIVSLSNTANNLILDPTAGTGKLINVNNTIEGAGDIGDSEMSLDNQAGGTIDANLATALIIQPNAIGDTNEGLLEATASGTLELDGQTITQSGGGTILSSGSTATVELVGVTVAGGTLSTTGGGLLETLAGQATLDNVTITSGSTYTGTNGTVTFLEGTITNQGTIFIDSSGSVTALRPVAGATVTLTGGGVVSLSNSVDNEINDPTAGTGRLINVNNTIEGAGNIGDAVMSLDNQAGGTIDANLASNLTIQPNSIGATNEGLIEATASGTLELDGQTFTQSGGGTILSSGSTATVELVSTTVVGGTLSTTGGGLLETTAGQLATLDNLTISSGTTYTGANGSVTFLEGTINNQGTFFLDSNGASTTEIRTEPGATLTLTGGGAVSLSNTTNNLILDSTAGTGKLINVNNTIQGAGNIGDSLLSFDNQAGGTIDANLTSTLTLQPNASGFSNEGVLEATSGGLLDITTGFAGGGQLKIGAGSEIELGGATSEAATFTGSTGKLRVVLPASANYTGTISSFGGSDILELANTNVTTVTPGTFNGTTTSVTVDLSSGGPLVYTLAGNYASDSFNVVHVGSDSDISVAAVTSGALSITAPASAVVGVGKSGGIAGVSIAEAPTTSGETFTVTLSDSNGVLAVNTGTAGGGGTATASGGGHTLTVSGGSLAQTQADLATLTDTDGTTPSDTITITAADSNGGAATPAGIAVTVNGLPVITAPASATVAQSVGTMIAGVSLAESGNTTGEIFTVTLSDSNGVLAVNTGTAGGGGTAASSGGGHTLTISGGTLAQVNADLGTLSDTDATLASDSIAVNAGDGFGNTAAAKAIAVTVTSATGALSITAPASAVVGVGKNGGIAGVSIAEAPTTSGETFTVTLSDSNGVLAVNTGTAGGGGTATSSGGGHTLTVSGGSLAQTQADLATLTDTDGTTPSDTITLTAADSNGGAATPAGIAVTVNGLPVITAPGSATVAQSVGTMIGGVSLAESGNTTGEIFTVTLSDSNGVLAVNTGTSGGGGTAASSGGGHTLTISGGTLAQVNADLGTLSDTDATLASDSIAVNAGDGFGNTAAAKAIAVTVTSATGALSITAPASAVVGVGKNGGIAGVSIAEAPTTSGETFTVTLSDSNGVLAVNTGTAGGGGTATSSGGGHTLTVSGGSLAQTQADLATLTDTDGTTPSDTITLTAADSNGGAATPAGIAVTVNGLPVITAPGSATVAQSVGTMIGGVSLAESGNTTGEIFTVTLSDSNGVLAVNTGTSGGGGTAASSGGGHTLTISGGTLAQVNADLGTLSDTDATLASDSIALNAGDGFGNTAAAKAIAVTVTPTAGQTFTFTTGVDDFQGGAGNDSFIATAGTLSPGDVADGGGGTNTLELEGGGVFNLAAPTTLADIQVITAQEGQAAFGGVSSQVQTIDLRNGLNATVEVQPATLMPGDNKVPTINIVGANNADIIDLATGNDVVTLGSAAETVNGGTGVDVFYVASATIGATINGGTSGQSELLATGGGTLRMGSNITNVAGIDLEAAATSYQFFANAIAGFTVDDLATATADTITAGGAGQTLTGGGAGKETMVGFGSGVTTYKDSAATFNNDTIDNFSASDQIDVTGLKFDATTSLQWVFNAATSTPSGTLEVFHNSALATSITLFGAGLSSTTSFTPTSDSAGTGTLITDPTQHQVIAAAH